MYSPRDQNLGLRAPRLGDKNSLGLGLDKKFENFKISASNFYYCNIHIPNAETKTSNNAQSLS